MGEVWKQIPGYEGLYEVSSLGRVRSLPRVTLAKDGRSMPFSGKVLKQSNHTGGYKFVVLWKCGKGSNHFVHRLVCAAFYGDPWDGQHACHYDGDKTNNRAENLRWASAKSNAQDKARHGTLLRGSEHGNAKITENEVKLIRSHSGTMEEIGREFGISKQHACDIRNRKRWAHIS